MNYRIINKDGKGVCPKCSGLLIRSEPLHLVCFDCHSRFKAIDYAIFDAEMIYEDTTNEE